jgi:hypothetical protein
VAGDEIPSGLLQRWTMNASRGETVRVVVAGLSTISQVGLLEQAITNEIPGVASVYRRSFEPGLAVLDVTLSGESDRFASLVQAHFFGPLVVMVQSFTRGELRLQARPRVDKE